MVSEVLGCDRCAKRGRLRTALGAAERSYPTSGVRGSGRECQAATVQEPPREAAPRPRSGAATRGITPRPRSGVLGGATPRPQAQGQGGGREDQRHTRGALAAWAQEGIEELFHVEGQEGQR